MEIDSVSELYPGGTSNWHRVIPALGVLILFGAVGKSLTTFSSSGILLEAVLDLLLVGSFGAVMLYVGIWLPNTPIQPSCYPRILLWVLGGVAVMGIVLALRVVHPGVTVDHTFGTQAVLLATGSIAGLSAGVLEAQARIHAEALEAQNDELRRTEQQLEEAVAKLEASNERLEQFAHTASHDLQEPLRMVTNYLELIDSRYGDELDEDGTEFLEFAVDGADRMHDMIDGLLTYSQVESQGDSFETVDLDTVLDDVLADIQFRLGETDGTVTRDPLPAVQGDSGQLRQVFQNLLTNAVDYSGDKRPRIHVTAERADAEWTIAVRDEGPGIDPDDVDRIFDVFERLHTTDEQPGSGIGLALSKRIVERHGGEMWVDSEVGVGSTFQFTLPPTDEPVDVTETGTRLVKSNS